MSIVNYYNGANAAGTTLTDLKGGNNGTLAGASLPTINTNGYLHFVGGNGDTAGNRSRVDFTRTSFQFLATGNFSLLTKFRTTLQTAKYQVLFSVINVAVSDGKIDVAQMYDNGVTHLLTDIQRSTSGTQDSTSIAHSADGKWKFHIVAHDGSNLDTFYNNLHAIDPNSHASGNLYSTNSKATLGARYNNTGAVYTRDFFGDIETFINFNHKLSPAEVKGYQKRLRGY